MPVLIPSELFSSAPAEGSQPQARHCCMSAQKRRHEGKHGPITLSAPQVATISEPAPAKAEAAPPRDNTRRGWQDRKVDRRSTNGGGYRC